MKQGVKYFSFVVELKITAQLISRSLPSLHILRSLGVRLGGGQGECGGRVAGV